VTMEETISNFADSLQGRLAVSLRRPNPIALLRTNGMRPEWLPPA
jgi:hypothetical protein